MSDMGVELGVVGDQPAAGTPTGPLPDYNLIEQLGHGATTTVYRARPTTTGPDVAIKMLRERTPDATQHAATYRREAALLARVTHPNVTAVHAAGQTNGRPYLILEHVTGTTLAHHLTNGPLPQHQTLQIATDVANALAAVHHMRLVHRDIKPGNLMITPSGHTKLIDFDLATWAGEPAPDGTAAGTLAYSAPEQTGMFARPVDARADLYALGIVLYECLTGQPPFTTTNIGELLHQHATEPPPPIHHHRPDTTPALATIITKLLAKDPDDRYQTATSLATDLQHLQTHPNTWPFPLDTTSTTLTATYAEPRLVGRQVELTQLIQRWERATSGAGGLMLIDAPAGTGKGRLISEAVETVTRRGGRALRARCKTDDALPLSVLRAAVQQYVGAVQRMPQPERDAAEQQLRHAGEGAETLLAELSPALATVLNTDAHAETPDDRQEHVAAAIAGFISELAHLQGGLMLVLEDVHRMDSASERVLQYLCAESEISPLLIVLTTPEEATVGVPSRLIRPPDTELELGPLSPSAVVELVATELGGADVPAEITSQLAARTGGNPFAILEYIRQLIDAGGLQPSWGTWTLDTALLDRLQLPSDVLDLMLTRLDGIDSTTRRLLATAAVQGMQFDTTIVPHVAACTADEGKEAITLATRHRIIEHATGDTYTFVHERVRDTLLADLDDTTRGRLHERTAEALESTELADAARISEIIYEIARHRIAAGTESAPRATYASCLAAGRLALTHHGPVEAVRFLAGAAQAAAAAGIDIDVRFRITYATALLRSGDFSAALDQATAALSGEQDTLRRAELFHLLATIQQAADDGDQAVATVQRGLADLGVALPQRMPVLVLSTLVRFLHGLLVGASRRRGAAAGTRRQRALIEASLLQMGAYAAALAGNNTFLVCFLLRALLPVNRLGPSALRVRVLTGLGYVAAFAGARRLGRRLCTTAEHDATRLDDAGLAAVAAWTRATIDYFTKGRISDALSVLEERGPLMDVPSYITTVTGITPELVNAGHTAAAGLWLKRAQQRLRVTASDRDNFLMECMSSVVEAFQGRAAAATATLQAALARLPGEASGQQRMHVLWARLMILVEQGELGEALDDVTAEIDRARLNPRHPHTPPIRYAIAYGRVAQAHAITFRVSSEDEVQRAMAEANKAIRTIPRTRIPRLRAGRQALRAWTLHLAGRNRAALRLLHRAQRAADGADAPLLTFDVEHLHARILRALQYEEDAEERATFALMLAIRHGWEYRARAIRDEFDIHDPIEGSRRTRPGVPSVGSSSGQSDARQGRRLEALQQVSATAASVLDPEELIRVALDVTLRMLSAERAFLFLADRDDLRPHRGCDADGNDLRELTNYSSTLVERVRETGEALVVTGSDEGAALGSQSAVLHGLRSILAAPLQLKGRLLGVVYLDSRVARGIFTQDDVELLVTINQQVAASLETARAAQLDAQIQAANRQRDLAETLSMSMTDLNSTLDPDEVLRRLLDTVCMTLPGGNAVLLRHDAGQLTLAGFASTSTDGAQIGDAESATFAISSDPTLEALATRNAPMTSSTMPLPAALSQVLAEPRSWLAVPIALRQERTGVIVMGSREPDSYSDVEVQIAAVLGDQGAAAYDNARLFSRVHEAATVDTLTGAATRRHFWELAEKQLATATRHHRPLAAIMLDIDHFKVVNDTHGHAVGDIVLREVATRVRNALREADIVGRYGGEEFAIILPETSDAEALAERLRSTVAEAPVAIEGGAVPVTASVGISYLRPDDNLDSLLVRADAALYHSKASGRNRVTVG